MQVIAPKEAVGFESRMAELDALDHLKWKVAGGEEFAEAPASVPPQRLFLDRHAAEAHRRPPELLLRRQRICPFGLIQDLWRRNENRP